METKRTNLLARWEDYRKARKQIKTLTKNKYRKFLLNMQDELKDNPRKFWSSYRTTAKTARISKTMHLGSDVVSSALAKAFLFNRFFASVFQDKAIKPNK